MLNHANLTIFNKDGWTSFHIASRAGNLDVLKEFHKSNPNLFLTVSANGRTPLHTAALAGHLEAVKFIINQCRQEVTLIPFVCLNER
jgi:ankyrin repeat protein